LTELSAARHQLKASHTAQHGNASRTHCNDPNNAASTSTPDYAPVTSHDTFRSQHLPE
jgi:hypothetical protein